LKKKLVLGLSLLTIGAAIVPGTLGTVAYADSVNATQANYTFNQEETDVKVFSISNAQAFEAAENAGIDVKSIIGEEAYNQALQEDMFRRGSSWIKTYKVGKETRISMGINSALVKTWKYGGRAAIYAMQAYGKVVGLPLDPMVANGMHNQLKTIDASRGYKWVIGTKPWRIVSHGYQ